MLSTDRAADITWSSGLGGNVKLELYKGGAVSSVIVGSTPNNGAYNWSVPANQAVGSNYQIRISSIETTELADLSSSFFSITDPPAYFADMDPNPGWDFSHSSWEYGIPTGGGQDANGHPDPSSGVTGDYVIGYRLDGDYEENVSPTRWATTPAIDCSAHTNVTLSFYRWLGVEGGFDNAYIQVSNDGTNWTQVWENSNTSGQNDDDGAWVYCEYDISTLADGRANVFVRWGMGTTDDMWHFCGWNLDDVRVDGDYVAGQYTTSYSVPYAWLADSGITNDFESAVTNDPDSDGFSTGEEYWSGTDPRNSDSLLRLDGLLFSSTNLTLYWEHSHVDRVLPCLLYTSDAADDVSTV